MIGDVGAGEASDMKVLEVSSSPPTPSQVGKQKLFASLSHGTSLEELLATRLCIAKIT
jgi:hypothetical protein